MTHKQRIAAACMMSETQLNSLVSMKKLSGKTITQIESDLERIAWLNGHRLVFANTQNPN